MVDDTGRVEVDVARFGETEVDLRAMEIRRSGEVQPVSLSKRRAGDILWALTSPDLYSLLVMDVHVRPSPPLNKGPGQSHFRGVR